MSGWSEGKGHVPSFSLLFYPLHAPKSKSEWVRTAISYAFLSALKFSHFFPFWTSRAGPRNGFQRRRNSKFYFSFPHPVPPVFYSLAEKLELLQLETSFHFRFTCSLPACKRLRWLWEEGPLSCHLKRWRARHTSCPASTLPRKGTAFLSRLFD